MANEEQLAILRQGVEVWNRWRDENPDVVIDLEGENFSYRNLKKVNFANSNLSDADFTDSDFEGADFTRANLSEAELTGANLIKAIFIETNLRDAYLIGAKLTEANFTGADITDTRLVEAFLDKANFDSANLLWTGFENTRLRGANFLGAKIECADFSNADLRNTNFSNVKLRDANFTGADLSGANFTSANFRSSSFHKANLIMTNLEKSEIRNSDLSLSNLVQAKVEGAVIQECYVYGCSVWDLVGEFKEQTGLSLHNPINKILGKAVITVDNLKIAQFIYLLLNNKEIRGAINTLTSKTVLILGRFTPERKAILDALRDKLREYNLLPIVFDFDRPTDKDFTETIKTLAGISYFVIADVTNPKSSPLELQATVPDYQIPFVPIIQEGESPFAMMVDLQKKYPWVLPTRSYDSIETLMSALKPGIIDPAVEMRNKLRLVKAQEQVIESLRDYVDKTL